MRERSGADPDGHSEAEFRGELRSRWLVVVAMSLGRLIVADDLITIRANVVGVDVETSSEVRRLRRWTAATRPVIDVVRIDQPKRQIRIELRDGHTSLWFRGPEFERQVQAITDAGWPTASGREALR